MKYWRGYITAGIFAAIKWVLMQLGEKFTTLVDMIYPYVTRMLQSMLSQWSGSVDFLLWQLIAVVLGVLLLASIVLMVLLRWNPIQWFGWVLATVCGIFFLHTCAYGLNNYAGSLADDIRLEVNEYTVSELAEATTYYRDKANELALKMDRDEDGDVIFPTFEEMAVQAGDGFEYLTYKRSFSVFAGSTDPVKELGWADMYTSMGITGFTMSLTGEAAVNPQIPAVSIPFTMCHEMAHRMCIAQERDANLAGFLACRFNSSKEFQYSAYYMAYRYCYNALAKVNSSSANALKNQIKEGVNDLLWHDLSSYDEFFSSKKDETATKIADTANDTYIKVSGDEKGVASYGEVCDLMVNWYIQEIILPTKVKEEEKFDPFDETQVDLTDLIPTVPETTEAS